MCEVASVESNSLDCSLPGSSVHGVLEWVAVPFSRDIRLGVIKSRIGILGFSTSEVILGLFF